MVCACLDDTKNQTRRVCKQATGLSLSVSMDDEAPGTAELSWLWGDGPGYDVHETIKRVSCPYGQPGDRLWVRETFFAWGRWETRFSAKKGRDEWHFIDMTKECGQSYLYAADGVSNTKAFIKRRGGVEPMYWKRPAIFMPRAACRITLEVTGARIERLQEISDADCIAEGCTQNHNGYFRGGPHAVSGLKQMATAKQAYRDLWGSINGPESWAANPWVWVVAFSRIESLKGTP